MFEIGFSIYSSSGRDINTRILDRVWDADFSYAFTSLHIPEEATPELRQEQHDLLQSLRDLDVNVMADIGPRTLSDMKLSSFEDLSMYPITHMRVDYGFNLEQMAKISEHYILVVNPSTFAEEDFFTLLELGVKRDRIVACHNFYPKEWSGLSLKRVSDSNRFYKNQNIKTMAFIAGDAQKRGPVYQGLPTVETMRHMAPLEAALKLREEAFTDVVLVGDIDLTEKSWEDMIALSHGYVILPCTLDPEYKHLYGVIQHDRIDSSDFLIRSLESRMYASRGHHVEVVGATHIGRGTILISNEDYSRYSGEFEIARTELSDCPRKNRIGQVSTDALYLLPYITHGMGFMLVEDLDN
ncbi:MAG: DUF871 domain-containing protein [Erysipelotrichaceae bacterium]|nr:DUF871 domain-containing protein [Erysipelotrichaceae bacterium]